MEQETITAGEITLRPFVADDIPWVYEVSLDPTVQRFVQIPLPYEMAHAEYFVREMANRGLGRAAASRVRRHGHRRWCPAGPGRVRPGR